MTTHQQHCPGAAGHRRPAGRPGRRAAPAQAGRRPAHRTRSADHRQDPTLDPRGTATHPDRGRDRRPGRLQRRQPAQGRRVPRDQDPRGFDVAASSIPQASSTTCPAWNGFAHNRTWPSSGPPGPARVHTLIGLGHAAVHAGHKVRYFTAADLVETLYRGLADNTVGKIIDSLLRVDLVILDELGFAPLDDTGTQLLFRLVAGAYERRSLAIGSHWPFEQWGRFLPEHTTAVSILDRLLHHATVVITDGESYRMRDARNHRKENATTEP